MRKLRLELDDLQVDSFATDRSEPEVGTVHGQATALRCSTGCDTDGATCAAEATCMGEYSCNGEYSCQLSCTDCNSYYCASGESCGQLSCVWTCAAACSEGHTYSCVPGNC